MSQSFSLYRELTVRQNLHLHAHLYQLPPPRIREREAQLVERFGLERHLDARAEDGAPRDDYQIRVILNYELPIL